jgi:hypothetical protein
MPWGGNILQNFIIKSLRFSRGVIEDSVLWDNTASMGNRFPML